MNTAINKIIGLRVDVDFSGGLKLGVPFILELFRRHNIHATFYVNMGTDSFFKNTARVSTKGYLKRLATLNPAKIMTKFGPHYFFQWLSGHSAIKVGADYPDIMKMINTRGHEVGVHGYDHYWWAENIWNATNEKVYEDMECAIGAFKQAAGFEPSAWASPNWRCSAGSIEFIDKYSFTYGADCRGVSPFLPRIDGYTGKKVQIPITLPCLHEVKNYVGTYDSERIIGEFVSHVKDDFNVWCIHDYYEGVLERKLFSRIIERLKSESYTFEPINNIFKMIDIASVPVKDIEKRSLLGGRGMVSCQAA